MWAQWGKFLNAKGEFLGLDAPRRTEPWPQNVESEPVNQEATEYLARLAIWARKHNAVNVDGYAPALPPGMTERPVPVSSNVHKTVYGSSMWWLAVEFPSEDEVSRVDQESGTKASTAYQGLG